jgi:hypothetical protein
MPRAPTNEEIEWVIAAKKLAAEAPQLANFSCKQTYWCAYTAWWDQRIALERTAPRVRVTAADVAAYETTRTS